jgi:magnesium-transporting ATPase (P-type)
MSLKSDVDTGLDQVEAKRRLEDFGPNVLPEARAPGALRLLLHQFQSLLIYVLLAAAIISLFLGDLLEFITIVVIAVLNACLVFPRSSGLSAR